VEQTARKIDRAGWGTGPWDGEPDRIEWRYKGLPCLMVRTDMGSLCGYVALPSEHPLFEKNYDDIGVNVHGGLTYASHCQGAICHVPQNGEPDNVWWLGFDCAHGGDFIPKFNKYEVLGIRNFPGKYRDTQYVKKEVERLADQLVKF
jgi:hypothetical protein